MSNRQAVGRGAQGRTHARRAALRPCAVAAIWLCATHGVWAQANASAPRAFGPFVDEQRQQERERALRQQQEPRVDARLPAPAGLLANRLPEAETPCFQIDRLILAGERAEDFEWALSAAGEVAAAGGGTEAPLGRCLGTAGVNIVLARVQQALIGRGWVTTRVLAAPQDLASGTLTLTLVPGRIAAIRFAEGSNATTDLRNAIAARPGDLLNLRDIEQALENFKRLPTADADIQIEPSTAAGAHPGDSDLVVKYTRKSPLRTTLSLDDSGTETTGRTQAGLTLAWDGPLGLNDLAYVSLNHDAFNHSGQGTSGQTLHYSIPYGDWLLGATASQNRYHQSVAGYLQSYVYSGESRNAELRLSRLIYRDQQRKTTVSLRGFRRASNSFVEDTEIGVQRRVVGGWELGMNHREFFDVFGNGATLDANLQYRRGTGAFGALPAPEEGFDEGTSRMRMFTADASLNLPFAAGGQRLRYIALWRAQWNRTPLTPQDRFSIGGRYTVRGFDGESSLMGDRGWLVRNDLGWALGQTGAELYAGLDYGAIGGPSAGLMYGRHLMGGAIGVRGAVQGLSYDLFIGVPISKPEGYRTAKTTAGFNLNYSF
ncbi:ShlB/FhaC/HecB family hemolysin secretion/activation protein [Variovorax ginsengisoli]|uniref:Hemolysin activation/secretion protein n=1 Tax=Variovorax ginsengisoli TaxID=363844 RepID=A0ABT9S0J5_9BURK|nr:ShlB/FhaC/HecB family hemolysin secretion/activation protein [Variovorax ginsengisoli]MDP9897881.1 hemolysin activation/secretion protein [Variovorax ginsengisoli]